MDDWLEDTHPVKQKEMPKDLSNNNIDINAAFDSVACIYEEYKQTKKVEIEDKKEEPKKEELKKEEPKKSGKKNKKIIKTNHNNDDYDEYFDEYDKYSEYADLEENY